MKLAALALAAMVVAGGGDLDAIRETQAKLVALRGENRETSGATQELTVLKHQLADWADSRIANSGPHPEAAALTATLNAEFDQKKYVVPDGDQYREYLGDVGAFEVSHPDGDESWLRLTTSVGVHCEYEDSVYLFEWRDGLWHRRFTAEQTDYTKGKYFPLHYNYVGVSQPDGAGERLVLAIANTEGCASTWQSIDYTISRIGSTGKTLLHGSDVLNIGDIEPYHGRIEPNRALIEFLGQSQDTDVLVRPHVLQYAIDGDKGRRIEPIALSAQDFVDEWLTKNFSEIAAWSDGSLRDLHDKLIKDSWHFNFVQRCTSHSDRWQIEVRQLNDGGAAAEYYFLVAQGGQYGFRMLDVSSERQPGCPGSAKPREGSDAFPTLFPKK
ncbi:MAG TPA: hypothetical protein VMB85_24230 [Bryobacteraceae bacterium]|nr:hypothetical protein [Bryobacteraceae bacterium]